MGIRLLHEFTQDEIFCFSSIYREREPSDINELLERDDWCTEQFDAGMHFTEYLGECMPPFTRWATIGNTAGYYEVYRLWAFLEKADAAWFKMTWFA